MIGSPFISFSKSDAIMRNCRPELVTPTSTHLADKGANKEKLGCFGRISGFFGSLMGFPRVVGV